MSAESGLAPTGAEAVAEWRRQVLEKVFVYMFWLLSAILLVEAALSLKSGDWHGLPGLAVGVLLQGVAAFARGLGLRARAIVFTIAAWLGVGLTLPVLGFALPIPFIVAMMTLTLLALCVGRGFALTSLASLVVILLAEGFYVSALREPAPIPALAPDQTILDPRRLENWIRVTSVFAAVGIAIIGAVQFLVRRLEDAVQHNGKLFVDLEHASREKIRALEEQRILEAKLRRGNELQLLGLLSATVAHDFNNLLMVINGNASLLKADLEGQAKQDVADIERAGEQAADLCRRLLTLAGERISGVETADLNAVIEAELPILRRLVTTKVKIEWTPGPPLWLKCARTEMRQALLNLCANARDAMPRGGHLRLSTTRVERTRPGGGTVSAFARFVVSDDGTGMDRATRERLFEPFFTTKGKGKGTGLGMVVVSQAVEQHDGFLELESEPGHGTTFSLFFPLVDAPPPRASERAPSTPPTAFGTTVLVVDDDEGARKMLARYLEKHGYTVLTANDGQEAVELLRRVETIDLVISDAMMPRMGGRALLDVVSEERPELPFLFCSAAPAGSLPADIFEAPHRALLPKPFSEEALLRQVEALRRVESGRATVTR